ncbi:MAG: peptidylprolyl isomerase [Pseudomonadota bacterium]|nr:peptidylprolyl isomerase [Pseudomonadota bacterium]
MKFLTTLAASGVISATLMLAPVVAHAQERIAVGTLNGETIWLDEIMAIAQTLPPEYREGGLAGLYTQLVDEVANSRLAAEAGRSDGLDQQERVANAMKLAADRVLAEAYMTDMVAAQITDDAIQTAYDNFVADSASRETVTAAHILVETEDEAKAIIAQLNDGADFAELAKEKSTGPSGPNGGELGSFGRGQMVPAFENAAFDMPVDSFSADPVQTQFGWHVIKVTARDIAPAPTLDQMREQIVSNLSRQSFARVVETLRAGAAVEVRPYDEVIDEAQSAAARQ